jgi:hypothetical protein
MQCLREYLRAGICAWYRNKDFHNYFTSCMKYVHDYLEDVYKAPDWLYFFSVWNKHNLNCIKNHPRGMLSACLHETWLSTSH